MKTDDDDEDSVELVITGVLSPSVAIEAEKLACRESESAQGKMTR